MTFLSWFLVNTFYAHNSIFYSGGDVVIRNFLLLGLLTRWGEAYSLDSWRRRKQAHLAGCAEIPPLRQIPVWPLRLMMLQLTIIYCATGVQKSGIFWLDGTALFYALSLDHYYRHPVQITVATYLQMLWVLPVATWLVKVWETAFPLALIGVALRKFESETATGIWPRTQTWRRLLSYGIAITFVFASALMAGLAAYYYLPPGVLSLAREQVQAFTIACTIVVPAILVFVYLRVRGKHPKAHTWALRWLFGKRLWLSVGLILHVMIDLTINVGTFTQVMLAVYIPWLSGAELDVAWNRLLYILARLRYKRPVENYVVFHAADPASVRRTVLLRCWDLGGRLRFELDPGLTARSLQVMVPNDNKRRTGEEAGRALVAVLPGFWWLYPWCLFPGARVIAGRLVLRTFDLRIT